MCDLLEAKVFQLLQIYGIDEKFYIDPKDIHVEQEIGKGGFGKVPIVTLWCITINTGLKGVVPQDQEDLRLQGDAQGEDPLQAQRPLGHERAKPAGMPEAPVWCSVSN